VIAAGVEFGRSASPHSAASRTAGRQCIRSEATRSGHFGSCGARQWLVFSTERGAPFRSDAVNRLIKRIGERAGFAFPVHCHMLRHACGSGAAGLAGLSFHPAYGALHRAVADRDAETALGGSRPGTTKTLSGRFSIDRGGGKRQSAVTLAPLLLGLSHHGRRRWIFDLIQSADRPE
jgi:hypothetical protein